MIFFIIFDKYPLVLIISEVGKKKSFFLSRNSFEEGSEVPQYCIAEFSGYKRIAKQDVLRISGYRVQIVNTVHT